MCLAATYQSFDTEVDGYVCPMLIDNSIISCQRAGGGPRYNRDCNAAQTSSSPGDLHMI